MAWVYAAGGPKAGDALVGGTHAAGRHARSSLAGEGSRGYGLCWFATVIEGFS